MDKSSSQSKQNGVPLTGITGTGGEGKGDRSGSAETGAATGKIETSAEAQQKKVLNENLMEKILHPENIAASLAAVKRNKGAAGIDGIGVTELEAHLRDHWKGIQAKLEKESYKPARCGALRCGEW